VGGKNTGAVGVGVAVGVAEGVAVGVETTVGVAVGALGAWAISHADVDVDAGMAVGAVSDGMVNSTCRTPPPMKGIDGWGLPSTPTLLASA
jgi:hypothetical protein